MPGLIAGVTEFGLFIELEGYFVQGLLHISELGSDYFHFHARESALVGEKSGRRFTLGDQLQVKVVDVMPSQGKIDLLLVEPDNQAQSSRRSKLKGQKGKQRGSRRRR